MKPTNPYRFHILISLTLLMFTSSAFCNAQNCNMAFSLTDANEIEINSTALTQNGDIIMVGSFKGKNVDFDPSNNFNLQNSSDSRNAFIASYKKDGQLNWVKTIGGEANLNFNDIALDASGRIYVCGTCNGTNIDLDPGSLSTNHGVPLNTTGMVVACYSNVGNYRWGFIVPAEYNFELQSSVSGFKIALDKKGNIYIGGSFQTSYVDFDPGLGINSYSTSTTGSMYNYDAFLVKYNQNGNFLWSAAIQSQDSDSGQSLAIDESGNAYFCGSFSGENTVLTSAEDSVKLNSAGETDIFISKFNANGKILWAKNMGGDEIDQANDIKLDSDTNIYITGIYKGSADMDPNSESAFITSRGNFDCFFAKYNNTGELIFAKSIGSNESDNVFKMAINSNNDIFLTGFYKARSDNDFDPGDEIKKLFTDELSGNNFLFLCSYNSDGNLNWATSGINLAGIYGSAILSLPDGIVFLGGRFYGSSGSIPTLGDNLFQLSSSGKNGIFLASISTSTGAVLIRNNPAILTVYPNPVSSFIKLKTGNINQNYIHYNTQVHNALGIMVYQNKGSIPTIESDLSLLIPFLPKGNYFIKMSSENDILKGSFIKN